VLPVNKDYFTKQNGDDMFDIDTRCIYVIIVEEITYYVYVYGVGEVKVKAQM
jgi:hypothetical protein